MICPNVVHVRGGALVDIANLQAVDVDVEDIAYSLARTSRFRGATQRHYSVLEHSLNVANVLRLCQASPSDIYQGLLHDAPEAYLGDVIRPLRHLVTDEFSRIERHIEREVFSAFRCEWPIRSLVYKADDYLLAVERHVFFGSLFSDEGSRFSSCFVSTVENLRYGELPEKALVGIFVCEVTNHGYQR